MYQRPPLNPQRWPMDPPRQFVELQVPQNPAARSLGAGLRKASSSVAQPSPSSTGVRKAASPTGAEAGALAEAGEEALARDPVSSRKAAAGKRKPAAQD